MITAAVILDSVSRSGKRLTSFEVHAPLDALAILNSHRMFSRTYVFGDAMFRGVVTATEYAHMFAIRAIDGAPKAFRPLAEAMLEAYDSSTPRNMREGEWHLPYLTEEDVGVAMTLTNQKPADALSVMRGMSAARCRRVSGDKKPISDDLSLIYKLLNSTPTEESAFEHQATPDDVWDGTSRLHGLSFDEAARRAVWGNFKGWMQQRSMRKN